MSPFKKICLFILLATLIHKNPAYGGGKFSSMVDWWNGDDSSRSILLPPDIDAELEEDETADAFATVDVDTGSDTDEMEEGSLFPSQESDDEGVVEEETESASSVEPEEEPEPESTSSGSAQPTIDQQIAELELEFLRLMTSIGRKSEVFKGGSIFRTNLDKNEDLILVALLDRHLVKIGEELRDETRLMLN